MKLKTRSILVLLPLLPLLLSACYSLAEDITPPPNYVFEAPTETAFFPLMPPNPQSGAAIFAEKCAPCHGEAGLGDGPDAADLPNPVAPIGDPELANTRTPEDWFNMVTNGNIERYMPPFSSLNDRERWDVVAYAFTLSTEPEETASGEMLYQDNCASCHGETGIGDGVEAINLGLTPGSFTDQSRMAELSLNDLILGMAHPEQTDPAIAAFALSDAETRALALFVRDFTFEDPVEVVEEPESPLAEAAGETEEADPLEAEPPEIEALSQGAITGIVSNASGGEVPAGLEIILYGFDQFQQVMTATTTVQADGSFVFEAVRMPEGRAFITAVDFQRGTYTSDIAVAGPEGGDLDLPLNIFESMTDKSQLSIDRLHVFFEFIAEDTVRVAELILVNNPTNRMIVGETEDDPVLNFDLPPGAFNLQFQEGAVGTQFVLTPDGFGDLRGIAPGMGQHQILFSFDMPYDRRFSLNQQVELPVEALVVLIPDIGIEVDDQALVSDGVRDIEGQAFELFTGGRIEAGTVLPVTLSGRPDFGGAGLISAGSDDGLVIGLVAVGLAFMFVGVWLFRRQRQPAEEPEEPVEVVEPVPDHIAEMNPDDLMDAIIALDDRYRAGDLPESAYQKQRQVLKTRLADLLEK